MAEKNVSIRITAESKDAEKGISKVTAAINKMGKNSTLKSVNQLASSFNNALSAASSLKSAMEAAAAAVSECADAYAKQRTAELALETAAKNNPYLDASNVSALKNYATELSKLSGIADEDLLPVMTKLAQSGRTESEIMKIMGAATDVAASGVMGFEQACDALNKTFVGEMGSLKELNPEIQKMTAEELKAGKAVDAMAKAFEGANASMGSITGGAERLKNAFTTIKEEIGSGLAEPLNSFKTKLAEVLEGIGDALKAARGLSESLKEAGAIEKREAAGEEVSIADLIKAREARLADLQKKMEDISRAARQQAETAKAGFLLNGGGSDKAAAFFADALATALDAEAAAAEGVGTTYESLEKKARSLRSELAGLRGELEEQANAEEAARQEAEANAEAQEARDKANKSAQEMIDAYKKRVEAVKAEIAARKALGEAISEQEENEQVYEAMYSGLVSLVSGSGGLVTVNNSFFKSESAEIAALASKILEDLEAQAAEKAERINSLLAQGFAVDDERVKEELKSLEETNEKIRELGGEPVLVAISVDTGGANEALDRLLESLAAAEPSADEWRQLSDQILELAEGLDAVRDTIPDAEFARLEERVEAAKASLTAPDLEGWQKLAKETEDIYSRIEEIQLRAQAAAAEGKLDLEEAYLEEVERLNEQAARKAAEAWNEYISAMKEKLTSLTSQITSAISQVASIITDTCSLMLDGVETSLDLTLAKLEVAYLSGEMGEEEYNEAVLKAKKEAAQAEYKIEMWEWTASLLSAAANIAEGVTKAIAQGGAAGIVTGALVSAAGAVQIATLIANKPIPPTFSTGGIVGGSSYTGDRVQALLNSGEMVLNAGQQKNLFDSINSGNISKAAASGQSAQTFVQVNNKAANIVSAEPEVSEGKINVMIDMRVNRSLKKGRYSSALTQAEQGKTGKWYGS